MKPAFVVCSDIHFSSTPPPVRRNEPDWYEKQRWYWQQLEVVARGQPIVIAGDIFDKPRPPAKLVNFVVELFLDSPSDIYFVAGQHDLPYHNKDDPQTNFLWTLDKVGAAAWLEEERLGDVRVVGCNWEEEVPGISLLNVANPQVLVLHHYLWQKEKQAFKGASMSSNIHSIPHLADWDAVFAGDNHIKWNNGRVYNCGSFMVTRSDQVGKHKPSFYLVERTSSDIRISTAKLDISNDIYVLDKETTQTETVLSTELVEQLGQAQAKSESFKQAATELAESVPKPVGIYIKEQVHD